MNKVKRKPLTLNKQQSAFVVLMTLFLIISFNYFENRIKAVDKVYHTLVKLNGYLAKSNENIIDISLNGNISFDQLMHINFDILSTSEQLHLLWQKTLLDNGTIVNEALLMRMMSSISTRDTLTEKFKSKNAILKNSISFLPILFSQTKQLLENIDETKAIQSTLDKLEMQLTFYLVYDLERYKDKSIELQLEIDNIISTGLSSDDSGLSQEWDIVKRHIDTVIEHKKLNKAILQQLLDLPTQTIISKLAETVNEIETQLLWVKNVIALFIFLFIIILILFILYLFTHLRALLKKTNELNAALEKRAEDRAKKLGLITDNVPIMMAYVDVNHVCEFANNLFAITFDKNKNDCIGQHIKKILSKDMYREFDRSIKSVADNMPVSFIAKFLTDTNETRHFEIDLVSQLCADSQVIGTYILINDITETHELSLQLSYQASHDDLTGLMNRRAFENKITRVLKELSLASNEHAMCFIDLDRFKMINDTCGHVAGDTLLVQLGGIIKKCIRDSDTVARIGGDEFGLLLENCPVKKAMKVANKVRFELEAYRFIWEDKAYNIGGSIGVAMLDDSHVDVTDILSMADSACLAAKNAGRNRVHLFSSDDETIGRQKGEMQQAADITEALNKDMFVLYAQPIMPLNELNNNLHYEILIRMLDKNGQIIPPNAFLPAAERYNLASKIDEWVISTVLKQLEMHPDHLDELFMCSINLSGQSISDSIFNEFILKALDKCDVPLEKLCFEITETVAITDLLAAKKFITKLKVKGCSIALDDFGSGLSSFGYLRELPFDYLKIDGTFIREIETNSVDQAIVESLQKVGHIIGKKIIAEFVETEQTISILKRLHIDYVQGYAIAKPSSLIEVIEYYREQLLERRR